MIDKCNIRFKVFFNEPLTREEEAVYLNTMATKAEKKKYFKHKKEIDRAYNNLVKQLRRVSLCKN